MGKIFIAFLAAALLTGCSGMNRSGRQAPDEEVELPSRAGDDSQVFSLPGVPLKFMPPPIREKAALAAEAPAPAPAPAPETAKPAPPATAAAPAQALSKPEEELQFHLSAAKRYALKKQYKSAAAEYGAARNFLPPGDKRGVNLAERQGTMLMRAESYDPAAELFRGAIAKAKELNTAGTDLANAHIGLGYCLEKQGNVPDALANYEKASAISPSKAVKARLAKAIADLKAAPPAK